MSSSSFDESSALRLATLRSQGSLTIDEQTEIVQLEVALSQHRRENPSFNLPVIDSSSKKKSAATSATATPSSSQNHQAATTSASPDDQSEYEVMHSTNENDSSASGSASSTMGSYFSSVVNTVSSKMPSKESLDTAAKAGWFWTSVAVGTAAPAVLGKQLGFVTEGFDHWNWVLPPKIDDANNNNKNNNTDSNNNTNTSNTSSNQKDGGLLLGALPVLSEVMGGGNHLKVLHKELDAIKVQMGMVVSALYEDEMKGFGVEMIKFANHKDWKLEFGNDVKCTLIQVDDCTPKGLDFEQVDALVKDMDDTMRIDGKTVYVHCKAGKGRSWVVTICYLVAYRNMTFDAAVTLVRARRHQVNPSKSQVGFAMEYYSRVMKRRGELALQNVNDE